MKHKNIVAFIPARGGSKAIPDKNIKMIAGRPLIHWTIGSALEAENIDKVVLATDSQRIADVALELDGDKLSVFRRDPENCTDTATTESAMLEYAGKFDDFTHMMLIQATSPLVSSRHLDDAIDKYFNENGDSLIALVRQLKFLWKMEEDGSAVPLNYEPVRRPRRQDFNGILTEPGAFYMTTRKRLLEAKCRISGRIIGYELPEELYFDLDSLLEWQMVELIIQKHCHTTG